MIRERLALGLLAALAAVSGCGDSAEHAAPPPAASGGTTTNGGVDPLAGARTTPVTGDAGADGTALLERVAVGGHEGFDRVVFEFRDHLPGYEVRYVDTPLREDGSGAVVGIQGGAFVLVRMEPASGFDLSVPEGKLVYKGPRRIKGSEAGTSEVREVVRTGDFEAVTSWAVGLGERVGFRVATLDDPPRLLVDFRAR